MPHTADKRILSEIRSLLWLSDLEPLNSKSVLSAWLEAVRREAPACVRLLEIRLGRLDTGFADRAVAGTPIPLLRGGDPGTAVRAMADALETDCPRVRTGPDSTPFHDRQGR
ncbi:hypothetical protein HUT18_00355 [Streptomyces sp. NA04227]|uniref:hypothetical protein n=1 Tax=Streptomyces sp. NA04227 TaxID=2742136 RepID=UPI001591F3A3|nr:hypothetical protein [Streptomyces sp. NA04227]QKW05031.1 hypothetical protein HUT18_00355 [Streptomyces sp. NA04227]